MASCEPNTNVIIDTDTGKMSGEGRWSGLPHDLLCLVAQRLYLPDKVRIRAVCKNWRLTTLPCFISKLPSLFNYHCCLSPPYQITSSSLSIPYLENYPCNILKGAEELLMFNTPRLASRCGWVLFSGRMISRDGSLLHDPHGHQYYYVYNPQTREVIQLPGLQLSQDQYNPREQLADFTSSPTSPDCTFLVLSSAYGDNHDFFVSTYNIVCDKTWETHKMKMDIGYLPSTMTAYMEGRLYFLDWRGRLSFFDIDAREWWLLSTKNPLKKLLLIKPEIVGQAMNYLVAYGGHLHLVNLHQLGGHGGCDVYRYVWGEEEWRRMESLEGGALFLGHRSVGVPAGDGVTKLVGNRVYYKSPYQAYKTNFLMYGPSPSPPPPPPLPAAMDSSWNDVNEMYKESSCPCHRTDNSWQWMWMWIEPPFLN